MSLITKAIVTTAAVNVLARGRQRPGAGCDAGLAGVVVSYEPKPREEMRGRKIRGTWPNGDTATATWDNYGEFYCDRFDELVGFDEALVGSSGAAFELEVSKCFWTGAVSVEWVSS